MSENSNKLREVLEKLSMEVYSVPLDSDDTLVCFARVLAKPAEFSKYEARILYFIEKVLQKSEDSLDEFKVRLSRPWVLKEKSLRYTWDFTIKGDLNSALALFESIQVPELSITKTEEVTTQLINPKKGKVKPVTVGTL